MKESDDWKKGIFQALSVIGTLIFLWYLFFGRAQINEQRQRRDVLDSLQPTKRPANQNGEPTFWEDFQQGFMEVHNEAEARRQARSEATANGGQPIVIERIVVVPQESLPTVLQGNPLRDKDGRILEPLDVP